MLPNGPAQILVVDDEPSVRKLLKECFLAEGFNVVEAQNGAEMHACLDKQPVDLITLDLKLGGDDGLSLAREIRSKRNVPIVIITGKGKAIDRVVGLELGADDYVSKPFNVRELVARVRAVLRRYGGLTPGPQQSAVPAAHDYSYAFEGWRLDPARRELATASGEVKELTTTEFNLLEVFVKCPQRVLTRDNIMDMLKGRDWSPFDRSIDSAVARLRKKIEPDPENSNFIKTVHGVGYVFTAEVKRG
jgi:DNA-binding response OmpR family regulator